MQLCALLFLVLLVTVKSDLTSERMQAVSVWIARSLNETYMNLAYSDEYSNNDTEHIVIDTGDFAPRTVAYSYDQLVLQLPLFIGYSPFILTPYFDPTTVTWINNDTIQVDYNMSLATLYNTTTGVYAVNQTGFIMRDYFVFVPDTNIVLIDCGQQDPASVIATTLTLSTTPNDVLCGYIFLACNVSDGEGGNYLTDANYTSIEECIAFMNALDDDDDPCPYVDRSNTTECRVLHALSSFFLPSVHCNHTRIASPVCIDTCLPNCSSCDPHASCVATYPNFPNTIQSFEPNYKCECMKGYVGNGTKCEPQYCSYGICSNSQYGTYSCETGLCVCTETFTYDSVTGVCTCPSPSQVFYNGSSPVCVPEARCLNQQTWQCTDQQYTQVKCLPAGNTFTLFDTCVCNYGFNGGLQYPCTCPSPNTIAWSNVVDGEVCLSPGECTESFPCTWPKTCHTPTGQAIGTCS